MGSIKEVTMVESIEGVKIIPLKQIVDIRGAVYHVFRNENHNVNVEEVYISRVNAGVIKGWKQHLQTWQRFVVLYGKIEIIFHDEREDSPTRGVFQKVILGPGDDYARLELPPMIWYAFRCLSEDYSLMVNISEMIHVDGESNNIPLQNDLFHYDWEQ